MPLPTATIERTLLDPGQQRELEVEGFTRVPGFLPPDEVARLLAVCAELHPQPTHRFETDFERSDPGFKCQVAEVLEPLWAERLLPLLDNHTVLFSSFLVKWPGPETELALHQDWTYVDEDRYRSIAAWLPLVDTDADLDNGPLLVLPRSHRFPAQLRGPRTVPWFEPYRHVINEALVPVAARAGDLILMDNRVLHASEPNRTARWRPVIAGSIVPAGAQPIHVITPGTGQVQVAAIGPDFFLTHDPVSLCQEAPTDVVVVAEAPVQATPIDLTLLAESCRTSVAALALPEVVADGPLGRPEPPPMPDTLFGRGLKWSFDVVHRATETADEGPLVSKEGLPWVELLEQNWRACRDEYDALLADDVVLPSFNYVHGPQAEGENPGWSLFALRDREGAFPESGRCPRTMALLDQIPGLLMASFSVIAPGRVLVPHRGPNPGVLRGLLGIAAPDEPGACGLAAGDVVMTVREGRFNYFDDTFEHTAWNRGTADRVHLLLEIERPLPGRVGKVNHYVQLAARWYPASRRGRQRYLEVYRALNS